MGNSYTVTGTLTDDRTVTLDEALPLPKMKVRLLVEPIDSTTQRRYREVMAEIRAQQQARGHQAPTREVVDAALRAERESWGE